MVGKQQITQMTRIDAPPGLFAGALTIDRKKLVTIGRRSTPRSPPGGPLAQTTSPWI